MGIVFIELILWAALIFFFWALKENLSKVESDIEIAAAEKERALANALRRPPFVHPEKVYEPIGSYGDQPIYQFAVVAGQRYQFEHVIPSGVPAIVSSEECCIPPGFVYRKIQAS